MIIASNFPGNESRGGIYAPYYSCTTAVQLVG